MIGSASAAAVTKTPLSLRARPAADTDRLDQHDFSHNDEPRLTSLTIAAASHVRDNAQSRCT